MKRLFLVLVSMASVASAFAQDVIVKRDGEEIQCRILEVSTNKVKYKQWKNQDGPTFVEKKTDVLMLKYENGQKEVISYSGPVSATQVDEEVVSVAVDSAALRDTMPISNDYLEYVRKEKSGLLMWGRSISEEKAHEVMGKDWTDFTRAHKSERIGRAMIFTGGALIVGGGVFTALHVKASNDYNDKKAAYEEHTAWAESAYREAYNKSYSEMVVAQSAMSDAQNVMDDAQANFNAAAKKYEEVNAVYKETAKEYVDALNDKNDKEALLNAAKQSYSDSKNAADEAANLFQSNYETNSTETYNTLFYNSSFKTDMDNAYDFKKATLYPMIGCYASGAALLIWGLIKENRAHDKVKGIVRRHNAEDTPIEMEVPTETETSFKPEFDLEGRQNGLALLMKF